MEDTFFSFLFEAHNKIKCQEVKAQQLKRLSAIHDASLQNTEKNRKSGHSPNTQAKIFLPSFITSTIMNHDTNDTNRALFPITSLLPLTVSAFADKK